MANRSWSLYRSLLNVHYGWSFHRYYYFKKRRRLWEPILGALFLIPFLLVAMGFLWKTAEALYWAGLSLGQAHLALVYGAAIVSVLGFFFSFLYVLAAFYFSNDLSLLLAWPLTPGEILLAKLAVVLTGQYTLNALVLAPMWLRYAFLAPVSFAYFLSAVLAFFLLPLPPLALASLLAVLLMRFVNVSRHKDKLALIGGLLLLFASLGLQLWLQGGFNQEGLTEILTKSEGLVRSVGRVFPSSIWASRAMAYPFLSGGGLNLAYLLAAGAVGLGILYLVGKRVLIASLLAGFEASKGRQRAKPAALAKGRPQLALLTLAMVEARLFIRHPGYALNGLVGYLLYPLLVILPLFIKNAPANPLAALAGGELPAFLILGGVALFFMLMSAFSSIAGTTFSREGRSLWIVRSLPLSVFKVLASKVLAAQLVNLVGCLLGLIPIAFFFHWPLGPVLAGVALGIPLAASLAFLLAFLDLYRPMLDWVNPIKAMKSNLNVMMGMFASLALGLCLGTRFYVHLQKQRLWLIPIELVVVTIGLALAAFYLSKRFAKKLWQGLAEGI